MPDLNDSVFNTIFCERPFGAPGYLVGLSIGIGVFEHEDDCLSFNHLMGRGELLQLPELIVC